MKADSQIRSGALVLALALAFALAPHPTSASNLGGAPQRDERGAVFTMDNDAAANRILAYRRTPDGTLEPIGSFVTGGRGTGAGLGNQAGLALSENGRWLFSCNAGSDDVTVFLVTPRGLVRTDQIGARGRRPISLALHGNLLFVLNAGGQVGVAGPDSYQADLAMSGDSRFLYSRNGDGTISAFRVNPDGSLTSRPGVTGIPAGASGLVAQ